MSGKGTEMLKRVTQAVLMTVAFGFLMFSANSAMAQGRGHYGQERRENRREYRQDVRRARREYRQESRESQRDRYRDNNRYYRTAPRGRAYGYYHNRPNQNNSNRYFYRNGRLYRRW